MRKHFAGLVVVLVMLGLFAPPVFAQNSATVKGVCKDVQGNPIADAMVVYVSQTNGQKYSIKANKKGEYFSLGLSAGAYNITLYKNADDLKAGKELFHASKLHGRPGREHARFRSEKEQERALQGQGLTPEQAKQRQEALEKQEKEKTTVKGLNDKIVAATLRSRQETSIAPLLLLNEATQMDATRDIIWAQLADAYRGSALKQTDHAEKDKRLQEAMVDYQKAIEISRNYRDR